MEGIIKRWMTGRNYGFIGVKGEKKDIFVHQSDVKSNAPLEEGQKVRFEVKKDSKGPRAINVEIMGEEEK